MLGVGVVNGRGGVYLKLGSTGAWSIGPAISAHPNWEAGVAEGVRVRTWHHVTLQLTARGATGSIDGITVFEEVNTKPAGVAGWVGIGASNFGPVQYDRFEMHSMP